MSDLEAILKLSIIVLLGLVMPAVVLFNLGGWPTVGVLAYMLAFNYLTSDMINSVGEMLE